MTAPAKYATPRDPSRRTDGARIARVAEGLGVPLMPWQRQVVDTATERDDEGRLVYELVFVTVPRQSGKSTLIWTLVMDRLLTLRNESIFYTAQTQQDARKRFRDLEKLTLDSPFADVTKFRRSMSDTGAECLLTGTRAATFAPGVKALHGETPPLVILDEIFAHSLELGDSMLEDAIIPAQQTLPGRRQVWLISTAGTAESGFMRKWLDIGRKGARPRMAFFEWSMPEGADPYAVETLESFHPAVGHLVTAEDLLDGRPPTHAAWMRGFCNIWLEAADPLLDLDEWDALGAVTAAPRRREVAIGVEVDIDGGASSVFAAWRDADGAPCLHTVHTAPGSAWLVPYVRRLAEEWRPRAIAGDNGGATRRVLDELALAGVDVVRLTGVEFATATDTLLTAARDGTLCHDGAQALRRGVAGAVLQRTGDTARISRHASTTSQAALIAAIVALRAYDHAPAPAAKPVITF